MASVDVKQVEVDTSTNQDDFEKEYLAGFSLHLMLFGLVLVTTLITLDSTVVVTVRLEN